MSDPVILFAKPGAISRQDKKALQAAGVVVVVVENPNEVKLIRAHAELSGTEMMVAAARAIKSTTNQWVQTEFSRAICDAIIAKQAARKAQG